LLLWVLVGALREGASLAGRIGLVLGVALAIVDSQASHALSASPVWLGFAANTIHNVAMSLWVGGLAALLTLQQETELGVVPPVLLARFSRLAGGAVLGLALSGLVLALQHLAAVSSLTGTAYGLALLGKLALVALTLAAAYSGRNARPAWQARWWRFEVAMLSAVLVLAALLVSLPPPA
jgi:copper transport protein